MAGEGKSKWILPGTSCKQVVSMSNRGKNRWRNSSVYSMLIKRLTLLLIDIFFFMTGEWPGYPPASWRR
jgi:hypothetical protein